MKKSAMIFLGAALGLVALAGCAKKAGMNQAETVMPAPVETVQVPQEILRETPVGNEILQETGTRGLKLETVYFDFDSYTLTPGAREILYRNAQWLKDHPEVTMVIEGHTDERGSDAYNIALGENRARASMNYLVTLGLPSDRLTVISYGEEKPAEPGHEEAAWAKNRRAEFR